MTRYRYAVLGLLLAGGYFTLVAGTMIRTFFDEADPRGWTLGMVPRDSHLGAAWSAAAVGALIVWALWQVARGPARNVPRLSTPFLNGGVDGLRRALYWLAGGALYRLVVASDLAVQLISVLAATNVSLRSGPYGPRIS